MARDYRRTETASTSTTGMTRSPWSWLGLASISPTGWDWNLTTNTFETEAMCSVDMPTQRLVGNGLRVRGRYLYKLMPWLRPFATIELGVGHLRVAPSNRPMRPAYEDSGPGIAVGAFGGIEAGYFGRRFGIGVEMRVGYDLHTPVKFDYDGVSPGGINLSGLRYGSALVITFHPQRSSTRARIGDRRDRRQVENGGATIHIEEEGSDEVHNAEEDAPSIIIEPKPEDEAEEGSPQD